MKLSILDQSIVRKGGTPADAISETIETAKLGEKLGYSRFWVSEHHNSTMIAGSAPELLMVRLASETATIRVGSGGIMLPNHSALKVAENFRMLETMYPGRIDLGMGRAPGSDQVTAAYLNPSNTFSEESYLTQLEHLQAFFADTAETKYGPMLAVPKSTTMPQQWILSSSGGSAQIAARFGMGLAIAKFINGFAEPALIESYRKAFVPSSQFPRPQELIAINVLCAETREKAEQLRKISNYTLLQFERGVFEPIVSFEEIRDHTFTLQELQRIHLNEGRIISGDPQQVRMQLTELAKNFDVDEIVVSTMTHAKQDRFRSFELLAEVFDL